MPECSLVQLLYLLNILVCLLYMPIHNNLSAGAQENVIGAYVIAMLVNNALILGKLQLSSEYINHHYLYQGWIQGGQCPPLYCYKHHENVQYDYSFTSIIIMFESRNQKYNIMCIKQI